MGQWFAMAACAMVLAGCQTDGAGQSPASASAGPPPANFRQLAVEHVKTTFKDPYTIRDAEIATAPKRAMGPSLNSDGFTTPWVICIRANAKNAMGAYTGRKFTAIAMNSEKVVNAWEAPEATGYLCSGEAYQPFPEIEEKKTSR